MAWNMSKSMRTFLCFKESFLDEQQHHLKYSCGELTSVTWQNFKRIIAMHFENNGIIIFQKSLYFSHNRMVPLVFSQLPVNELELYLRLKEIEQKER